MDLSYTSPSDGWSFTSTSVGVFDPGNYSSTMSGSLPQYDHLDQRSSSSRSSSHQFRNYFAPRQPSVSSSPGTYGYCTPEIIQLAKEYKLCPTLIKLCEDVLESVKFGDCPVHRNLINQLNNTLKTSVDPFASFINNSIMHFLDDETKTYDDLIKFEDEIAQKIIAFNKGETITIITKKRKVIITK